MRAMHIPSANRIPPIIPKIIATKLLFFIISFPPFSLPLQSLFPFFPPPVSPLLLQVLILPCISYLHFLVFLSWCKNSSLIFSKRFCFVFEILIDIEQAKFPVLNLNKKGIRCCQAPYTQVSKSCFSDIIRCSHILLFFPKNTPHALHIIATASTARR